MSTHFVDLRSDTVSLPTPEMRRAIYDAVLGDDQYGEDETTNRLQRLAAEMVGKEAALLVLSGTMGNLVSALAHTEPGQEVILDVNSHFYNLEVGGLARIGGLVPRPLNGGAQGLDPKQVEQNIRAPGHRHRTPTGLVVIENTSNRGGGSPIPLARLAELREVTQPHNIPSHMDGARLFNAAVALHVDAREITQYVDSVQFCLSKGLGAPLGSIVAGSAEFVERARQMRQLIGGGMRQSGIIAAAGIVALETMIGRMAEDHANAKLLAEGVAKIKGLGVDPSDVQTNIVYVDFAPVGLGGAQAVELLAQRGVKANATGPSVLRFVTYHGINRQDIQQAVQAIREVVTERACAVTGGEGTAAYY